MSEIEQAVQMTEELLQSLKSEFQESLWEKRWPTRAAYNEIPGTPNSERAFAQKFRQKLADRNRLIHQYFTWTAQDSKVKLFTLLAVESSPFGDYNTTVATFVHCLEREREVLIEQVTENTKAQVMEPGSELRRARERKGQTLEQAAEEIGCNPSSVSRIERGRETPKGLSQAIQIYIASAASRMAPRG